MQEFQFRAPTQVLYGGGSLKKINERVKKLNAGKWRNTVYCPTVRVI